MKRKLTLAGSICGVVASAVLLLIISISTILTLGVLASYISTEVDVSYYSSLLVGVVIEYVVITSFSIVSLALNSVDICAWRASKDAFVKKKGCLVASVVFNFILAFYTLISVSAISTAGNIFMFICLMPCFVIAGVFVIVDLCLEKKRIAEAQAQNLPKQNAVNNVAPATPQNTSAPAAVQEGQTSDLDAKIQAIEKLAAIHKSGLLSKEEFEEAKAKILNKD